MSDKLKNVMEVALTLSREERGEAIALLLDSLESNGDVDQASIDAATVAESDRRYQAYKRGEMKSVPVEEILEMCRGGAKQ